MQGQADQQPVPQGREKDGSRLYLLDFVRIVAIVAMVQGHVISALARQGDLNYQSFGFMVWNFFRGLTAPTFLMISGAVAVFANKRRQDGTLPPATVVRRILRSLLLVAVGYLLVFPARSVRHLGWVSEDGWKAFFAVNILQLVGVSLLLMTLLFASTRNSWQVAVASGALGVAVLLFSPYAYAFDWNSVFFRPVASYFSYQTGSVFPVFPYTAYMLLGVPLGAALERMDAMKRAAAFDWKIPALGAILVAASLGVSCVPGINFYPRHDVYNAGPLFSVIKVGAIFVLLGPLSWLYRLFAPASAWIQLFGAKALNFYVLHLVVLYGSPWWGGLASRYAASLPVSLSLSWATGVAVFCFAAIGALEWFRRRWKWAGRAYAAGLCALVYYLLFQVD